MSATVLPARLDDLFDYLWSSPSPYHAVASARRRLEAAGWRELDLRDDWGVSATGGKHYCVRGGALVAWDAGPSVDVGGNGFRIIGAHTDSPNLRIKPNPDSTNVGYRMVGVEVYGGALLNSWLDRDLGVSGRLHLTDGRAVDVVVNRPLARVSQLAIHLDRDVNEKGLVLDKQLHVLPMTGLGEGSSLLDIVAGAAGVERAAVAGHDLMLHDLTPPAQLGLDGEFIVSARIDNQFSCWASVTSLIESAPKLSSAGRVVALFDHEEVGSSSTTGAAGPLLEHVLQRLSGEVFQRACATSMCLSSDMAHAVHPNYAERHEPNHRPMPNGGPVIKVNANQRYATDAAGAAAFASVCAAAGVPTQWFVSRNSQPCGSTIGPITATRLGIDTVDVGGAMLSMHSARELCGSADVDLMVTAMQAFLTS